MSPLLGRRAVDGPALTRDATAGGSLGIVDEKERSRLGRPKLEEDGGAERGCLAIRSSNSTPNVRLFSACWRKRSIPLCSLKSQHRFLESFFAMSASCEPLLEALKDCLMRSDCVLKKGKLPSECLRQHTDELPDACKSLRHAVFECKRGLVSLSKSHIIRCGLVMTDCAYRWT